VSDFFASPLERAFALVDAGHYVTWPQVAERLAREGYGPRAISQLGRDRQFKRCLAAAMLAAEERRRAADTELKAVSRMSPALPIAALGRRR
jgi:hypothetical protein